MVEMVLLVVVVAAQPCKDSCRRVEIVPMSACFAAEHTKENRCIRDSVKLSPGRDKQHNWTRSVDIGPLRKLQFTVAECIPLPWLRAEGRIYSLDGLAWVSAFG